MFGLFKAKPPVGPWEKAWVEHRMCWLTEQFGMTRLLEAPTLVSNFDGIPDVHDEATANELFDFLQTWMKVDGTQFRVQVFSDVVAPESIGTVSDEVAVLKVTEEQLADRSGLIGGLANVLARQALIDVGVEPRTADDEWTISLYPVFLGLGIFVANAKYEKPASDSGSIAWWSVRQRGNLPARMTAYALALRSWTRHDQNTAWEAELRQDAISVFQDGRKYLDKTSDSVFSRDTSTKPRGKLNQQALLDELRSGSPSRKISAMWGLSERAARRETLDDAKTSELIMDALRHKQAEVRAVAATTLPAFDRSPHAAQDLADALADSSDEVRIAAAGALSGFAGVDDETLVFDLTKALNDDERLVVFNAARSLTAYGDAAQSATKTLLKRLRRALVECRDDDAFTILWALDAIVPDARQTISSYFDDSDAEYLDHGMQILEQIGEMTTSG